MRLARLAGVVVVALGLIGCGTTGQEPATGRPQASAGSTTRKSAAAGSAISKLNHPVSTQNPAAQRAFNEGLTYVYAFNHDEGAAAFRRAAQADPKLGMAYWGIAFALGTNYNEWEIPPERAKAAYEAIQKATELSAGAPEPERAYIAALAKRYAADPASADPKRLAADYAAAMNDLARRYPDDLDAATLAADAGMNLRPWRLYALDGTPAEGTEEIVALLESVMRRDPDHIGANHLYIHAVEASRHPERALEAAARLPGLAPSCGHLVHMPSHVYSRTGDSVASAGSNEAAIAADEAYFRKGGKTDGIYGMMYYNHNIHFLAVASADAGNYQQAKAAAEKLAAHAGEHVKHMPMLEGFMLTPLYVAVRFARWDELLSAPEPDKSLAGLHAMWHFARGMAHAGRGNTSAAETERAALAAEHKALPPQTMLSPYNKTDDILAIAEDRLAAQIARAGGDAKSAAERLRAVAAREDQLNYIEPPDWYLPARESLGTTLLASGDAAGAEKAFRDDLQRHTRSGRSLFGLMESLKAQGRSYEADLVRQQFEAAWTGADTKLAVKDL
jgi:hypothetical protein